MDGEGARTSRDVGGPDDRQDPTGTGAGAEPEGRGGSGAPGAADPVDLDPEVRPGVPMEAPPSPVDGAHWSTPPPQSGRDERLTRAGRDRATPVFGSAQPPHGLSGRLRKLAYAVPEHYARHWMLLMAADRVDVAEDRLGAPMSRPLEALGLEGAARRVRSDPLTTLAGIGAGILLASAVFGSAKTLGR